MLIRLEEWEGKLHPVLEEEGAELVKAQVQRGRSSLCLRFFVDREAGVGIEDLARLSRKIGTLLDADPGFAGKYELEVSSPGMDRPVWKEGHFRRFVGERVHLWTMGPIAGGDHFEGTIAGCHDGVASIQVDGLGTMDFDLTQIERAELRLDPKRPPQRHRSAEGSAVAENEVPKDGQ
jgi:ribosome maturation factor RimP